MFLISSNSSSTILIKTTMGSFLFHNLWWRLEGMQTFLTIILEFHSAKFILLTFKQIKSSKIYNKIKTSSLLFSVLQV
jgi:hypothetical protein